MLFTRQPVLNQSVAGLDRLHLLLTLLFVFLSLPPRRRRPGGLLFLIHQPPGGVTGITTFSHLKTNDFLFLSH